MSQGYSHHLLLHHRVIPFTLITWRLFPQQFFLHRLQHLIHTVDSQRQQRFDCAEFLTGERLEVLLQAIQWRLLAVCIIPSRGSQYSVLTSKEQVFEQFEQLKCNSHPAALIAISAFILINRSCFWASSACLKTSALIEGTFPRGTMTTSSLAELTYLARESSSAVSTSASRICSSRAFSLRNWSNYRGGRLRLRYIGQR